MAESSYALPSADKPVIVRVKRKVSQSALDAFWLEINERPSKRPLIDFGKLSISDASPSSSKVEEFKTQKILVRHVETVTSSKGTFDVLRSFVPNSSGELKSEEKNDGRRRSLKTVDDKQDQLLLKARQRQEVLSRNARFEQIWRSRKENKVAPEDEAVYDMCRLYDVVRVDVEEHVKEQNQKDTDLEDYKLMADFLPLLREVLPTAAEEIEHDIRGVMSKQASSDGYVYDVYAVEEDVNEMETDSTSQFPLVQVDDDEHFYDGPDDSECESDDSNAENNPLNDYPDEDIYDDDDDDDDDEATSRSSDENSEDESTTSGSKSEGIKSGSQVSYDFEKSELYEWSDYADQTLEDSEGDEEEEPY